MKKNSINHNALTLLIEADAITVATAKANDDIWTLSILVGNTEKTVMAKNSGKARIWRKLDTLAKYLKKLGLSKFEIDVSNYDPDQKSLTRPDSAASLKRTHQAHKARKINRLRDAKVAPIEASSPERIKEKWEERRARILAEENPRV